MDATEYIKRWKTCASAADRTALLQELHAGDETLRTLFSSQRDSWEVPELENPEQYLVPTFDVRDVFAAAPQFPEQAEIPKVFALDPERRLQPGVPTIVTQQQFLRNFELFTEGMLRYMDWNNVVAAGGCVLACLQPVPGEYDDCNRSRRKYFHDQAYPGSDVDLFMYGLDAEGARRKIIEIYDSVREACPYDAVCFRSAHAISVVTQYPYRHVQVVLRLYSSPCEVLAGFDVDSCSIAFDGKQVWASPRCHQALVTQCNPVNMSRRSPTYEMRLAKYAKRGFEVSVPNLNRKRLSPMLFEQPWHKVQGLAKLLLLEQLSTPDARFRYKEQHRLHQMRKAFSSSFAHQFHFRSMMSNPWLAERMESVRGGVDASDYSTVFLPWGPGYDAKRCIRLMAAKDKLLNNPFLGRSKGRKYKLHPCFWGSAETVLGDCCPNDPPIPEDADRDELAGFVRGPLTFIEDDPGRQMIGSFHPITAGDWREGAYLSPETEALVLAANCNDTGAIRRLLQPVALEATGPMTEGPEDAVAAAPNTAAADAHRVSEVNRVDFFGRSALHVATMSGCTDAVQLLLQLGANLGARMVDGRTALHLAVMYGRDKILDVLLAEHARCEAAAKELAATSAAASAAAPALAGANDSGDADSWVDGDEEDDADADEDDDEGRDDGSSDRATQRRARAKAVELTAESKTDGPPPLGLDDADWGRRMTALHYALTLGRVTAAQKLVKAGATAAKPWVTRGNDDEGSDGPVVAPVMLLASLSRNDAAAAGQLLDLLVTNGVSLTQLDLSLKSYLHLAIERNETQLLHLLLTLPSAAEIKGLVDSVSMDLKTPLLTAVEKANPEAVSLLLAAGATPGGLDAAGCERARQRFVGNPKALRHAGSYVQNRLRNLKVEGMETPLKATVLQIGRGASEAADDSDMDSDDDTSYVSAGSESAEEDDDEVGHQAAPLHVPEEVEGDVPELAAAEQAEVLGGRTAPDVAKPKRQSNQDKRLAILKQLIAAGAETNLLEQPHATVTEWLQQRIAEQQQKCEEIRRSAGSKVPAAVLQGSSAALRTWAQDLVRSATGGGLLPEGLFPAALEAYKAYLAKHGSGSYLADTARACLEQDQASFLVGVATILASSPEVQLRHLRTALDMLRAAGGRTLKELQGAGKPLPAGARLPEAQDVKDANAHDSYRRRRLLDFVSGLLSAPCQAKAGMAVAAEWGSSTSPYTVQYSLLPEPEVEEDGQVTYPRKQDTGLLLPEGQQAAYHSLFEAIWRGDIAEVDRLTAPADAATAVTAPAAAAGSLFVAVHNTWGQTTLALAVLRGDAAMTKLLLQRAAQQYTPPPKEEQGSDVDDDQEGAGASANRINNFALVTALQNAVYNDHDYWWDSENGSERDSEDSEGHNRDADNVVADAQEMQRQAVANAQRTKLAVAGITLDEGAVAPDLRCHADALSLLHYKSKLPSAALLRLAGISARMGAKRAGDKPSPDATIVELWEAVTGGADGPTLRKLLSDYGLRLDSYWISMPGALEVKPMIEASPLQTAALIGNPELLRAVLSGFEAATAGGQAPLGAAAVPPPSEVLHRLLRWVGNDSPSALDVVIDRDQPECLRVLLEYVGLAPLPISLDATVVTDGATLYASSANIVGLATALHRKRERRRRGAALAAPGAVPPLQSPPRAAPVDGGSAAPTAAPEAAVRQIESWTLLHAAALHGAVNTARWLLQGNGLQQALSVHLDRVMAAGGLPAANVRHLATLLGATPPTVSPADAGDDRKAAARDAGKELLSAWALPTLLTRLGQDIGMAAPPTVNSGSSSNNSMINMPFGWPGGVTAADIAVQQDDAAMLEVLLASLPPEAVKNTVNRRPLQPPLPPAQPSVKKMQPGGATGYYNKYTTPAVTPADYVNTTLLQAAAYWQSGSCFELLLRHGADPLVADMLDRTRGWNLAVFLLAGYKQPPQRASARAHGQDAFSRSPEEVSATLQAMLGLLLDAVAAASGGDVLAAARFLMAQQGPTHVSALMLAAHKGLVAAVELMLRRAKGAVAKAGLTAQGVTGRTALHAAAHRNRPRLVRTLVQHEEPAAAGIDAGSGVENIPAAGMEDFVGNTPLDVCIHLLLERLRPATGYAATNMDVGPEYMHNISVLAALLAAHPDQRRKMPTLDQILASRQHFAAIAAEQAAASRRPGQIYAAPLPQPLPDAGAASDPLTSHILDKGRFEDFAAVERLSARADLCGP